MYVINLLSFWAAAGGSSLLSALLCCGCHQVPRLHRSWQGGFPIRAAVLSSYLLSFDVGSQEKNPAVFHLYFQPQVFASVPTATLLTTGPLLSPPNIPDSDPLPSLQNRSSLSQGGLSLLMLELQECIRMAAFIFFFS